MVKIDETIIDELVAGNLNGEQYRRVLLALENQPDGWKDCALAFLQEQALTRELKALSVDDAIWNGDRSDSEPVATYPTPTAIPVSTSRWNLELATKLTSLAALLLISFTVGWYGSGLLDSGATANSSNTGDPDVAVVANTTEPKPGGSSLANNMTELNSAPRPYSGRDLMSVDTTPEVLRELQRRGAIDVESVGGLIPIYDESEEAVRLVPVQQYRVKKKYFFLLESLTLRLNCETKRDRLETIGLKSKR